MLILGSVVKDEDATGGIQLPKGYEFRVDLQALPCQYYLYHDNKMIANSSALPRHWKGLDGILGTERVDDKFDAAVGTDKKVKRGGRRKKEDDLTQVHEHGHVALDDHMGDDLSIVNNARVSFNDDSDVMDERNAGLINFLMKNRHGSPFEAVTLRFDVKAPLFVFREWHRHRAGHSYNEWSARYSVIEPEFYVPQRDYVRHQIGKPGAYTFERMASDTQAHQIQHQIEAAQRAAYRQYEAMIERGVAKEVARVVLPVGTYSRMKWTCNLRSLMHFLSLRNSEHAQREIRDYAIAVEAFALQVCPVAMQTFVDNGRIVP